MTTCKICGSHTRNIFEKKILDKYTIAYQKCDQCGCVQTEKPYWLTEAYSSAITALDLGLVQRNIGYSAVVSCCIELFFNKRKRFVDFAGGYGMLVRMLRDKGYDFFRKDLYCENLFAKEFDITDLDKTEHSGFELLTAFEVMEHLENPLDTIDQMLTYSDNILFSTALYNGDEKEMKDWWYISPETGQHIVFYTRRSLEIIAKANGLNFYTNNRDMHLFTKKKLPSFLFKLIAYKGIAKILAVFLGTFTKSLLQKDVAAVKYKLLNKGM